jgi:DNA-directed RNA polymerase specialized sigma24 family protein
MYRDRQSTARKLSLAACAVAVAATVGSAARAEDESGTLENIQKYCTASWRNAGISQQDWDDCTQQAITFLLERVPRTRLPHTMANDRSDERRELNRAIWRTAQRWRRAPRHVSLDEFTSHDRPADHSASPCSEESEAARALAEDCLSTRQQHILKLWGDGWSIGEIASQLDLSPSRASDEKYKALRKLRSRLAPVA